MDPFPSYELRFEHLHSNGVIALRALVLSQYETEKDLRLLTSDMVASIAGGYDFRVNEEPETNANVRLAARQVAEGPAKLAGQEAYASIVDIANVDQALISAQAVTRRVELVLVRSGLTYTPVRRNEKFPVYLSGVYIEHPTQFDAHLPAFKQLLGQIRIAGHTGYEETLKPVSPPAVPQQPPNQPVAPPASPSEAPASQPAS